MALTSARTDLWSGLRSLPGGASRPFTQARNSQHLSRALTLVRDLLVKERSATARRALFRLRD